MEDDLTVAYMAGYHKRDDEVRSLRKRLDDLSGDNFTATLAAVVAERDALRSRVRVMEEAIEWALGLNEMAFGTDNKCHRFRSELRRRAGGSDGNDA